MGRLGFVWGGGGGGGVGEMCFVLKVEGRGEGMGGGGGGGGAFLLPSRRKDAFGVQQYLQRVLHLFLWSASFPLKTVHTEHINRVM